MEWSIFVLVLGLTCVEVSSGRAEWKRITKLEETIHHLAREVKDLKAVRCRQERTSDSRSSQEEIKLASDTLSALEVESRALSQFDSQMRSLQTSLEQLSRHKNQQVQTIDSFRRELDHLKSQVEAVEEKSGGFVRTVRDTSAENAVKTLQWLLKSVSNLKIDVNQINQSLNVSKSFQQAEEVQKQIHLVQSEVSQLRHQSTEESAERQRMAAEMVQLRSDLKETADNHHRCLKDVSQMTLEIQSLRTDWNASVESAGVGTFDSHSRSVRYGHWNHKFNELKNALQSVREMQDRLERRINSLSASAVTVSLLEPIEDRMVDISQQCTQLESKLQVNEAVLATLEASQNTMHEQMELIGEQNDFQAREIQLAVDQLHYNFTQIQVHWEQALQHMEITDDKLSRISTNVGEIESEMEKDRITVLTLQNKAMNETLQKCKDDTREEIQDMKLQNISYQIETLKFQMDAFNKTMNSWNGAFVIGNGSADESVNASSSEESNEK